MTTGDPVKQGQLNPKAIAPEALARLLTAAGGTSIDVDDVRADIDAGAPSNADGTIDLVHYAAWLVRQVAEHGGRGRGGD